jgi:hypothetical protein
MKFKNQLITACVTGLLIGGTISTVKADETQDWLPSVICKDNRVYVVFTKQSFYIKVNNIFCTYNEDLVKL